MAALTDPSELAAHAPSIVARRLIDSNVSLFRWPLRRVPLDETPRLVSTLRDHQVKEALAGSLEGLLHKDQGGVNSRLTEECRRRGGGILRPVGSMNLRLPDWESELRRCAWEHRMPGIRLHPNYLPMVSKTQPSYFESALLKLQESELSQKQLDAIASGNASSLVKASR